VKVEKWRNSVFRLNFFSNSPFPPFSFLHAIPTRSG
jgi:hypothetical protein